MRVDALGDEVAGMVNRFYRSGILTACQAGTPPAGEAVPVFSPYRRSRPASPRLGVCVLG